MIIDGIQYRVEGRRKLAGDIEPSGNKNAALPIIAASLLTDQPVCLANVPRIRDVEVLVELIRTVGAEVSWTARNELEIEAKDLRPADRPDLCARIRASILLAGPDARPLRQLVLPPPRRNARSAAGASTRTFSPFASSVRKSRPTTASASGRAS
ncbi:MAG: hypothetical protein R3C97_11710 [Geminicoccaceae bacterium]